MTTQRRTRRRLTIENSHELHKNPYDAKDLYNVMQWAKIHRMICEKCRNKRTRQRRHAGMESE